MGRRRHRRCWCWCRRYQWDWSWQLCRIEKWHLVAYLLLTWHREQFFEHLFMEHFLGHILGHFLSYLIFLNPLPFKNIAYVGSFNYFAFVYHQHCWCWRYQWDWSWQLGNIWKWHLVVYLLLTDQLGWPDIESGCNGKSRSKTHCAKCACEIFQIMTNLSHRLKLQVSVFDPNQIFEIKYVKKQNVPASKRCLGSSFCIITYNEISLNT